jgi:hypothetical protein
MKQQPTTEEELIRKMTPLRQVVLSEHERVLMKQELLTYAQFHTPAPATSPRPSATSWLATHIWRVGTLVTMVVCTVMVGTGYIAQASLPGEPLYGVKVEVVEPLVGLTHIDHQAQLEYHVTLLKRRLEEVALLQTDSELSTSSVAEVVAVVTEHVANAELLLTESDLHDLSDQVVLAARADMYALTEAHAKLVEPVADESISELVDVTADRYVAEVASFTATSPTEEVGAYVQDVLSDIHITLQEDSDVLASSTIDTAVQHIEDAAGALQAQDLEEALLRASAADHALEVELYLEGVQDEAREIVDEVSGEVEGSVTHTE